MPSPENSFDPSIHTEKPRQIITGFGVNGSEFDQLDEDYVRTHGIDRTEPLPADESYVPIHPEDVTPQMQANALGSPFIRDEVGRIVPRNPDNKV